MKLEQKLTCMRKEQGLTQAELAETLGVSRQAVSRWEGGQSFPSMENLSCLSRLYGVSVDDLVNDREKPPPKEPPPADAGGAARRWMALALVALSLAVLILAVCVGALLWEGREDAHNLRDLTGEEGVVIDGTFSLEGW